VKRILLLASALFYCIGWSLPASADPGRGAYVLCYVFANNPSPPFGQAYTPIGVYSYNTVGRAVANSVARTAVGVYTVTCRGVGGGPLFAGSGAWGTGGHVQVTATGPTPNFCKVNNWVTGGADFSAVVHCYRAGVTPADTPFNLLFVW